MPPLLPRNPFAAALAALLLSALVVSPARAVELKDAAGRAVQVPDSVERAFGTAPPVTLLVEVVAPGALVATNAPLSSSYYSKDTRALGERFRALPAVGGWHGSAKGANMEELLKLDPQLVVAWRNDYVMEPVLRAFSRFRIPVVFVDEDRVADEPEALRVVGKALGRAAEGEALAREAERRLKTVADLLESLPGDRRPLVYYAEGADGLRTEFENSFHFDPFLQAGARSLFRGAQSSMVGMERISMEELLRNPPDLIVADSPEFLEHARGDRLWSGLEAVKKGRVYLIPKEPLSFLDRPPCFMRILGVQWLASVLYPDDYKADIVAETVSFYRDFLHCTISREEAARILGR